MPIVDASATAAAQGDGQASATVYYYSPMASGPGVSGASGNLIELVAPRLSSAVALSPTLVRATFDEPMMNDAALNATSSYSITPTTIDGAPVAILDVIPELVDYPTYVDLQVTEMTDGKTYQLFVENVKDPSDNEVDPVYDTIAFTGDGSLPQLTSIETISATKVRFHFSEAMKKDAALSAPSNYALMPVTPGAAPLYFTQIELPEVPNPTYVDITVSEMTDGATYQGGVVSPSMTDKALNPVDPGADTYNFTGLGDPPAIKEVRAIGENRVDVVFSEPMDDNADIRNPAKYTWTGGLTTINVLDVQGDTVSLVTSDQTPGEAYTLSVSP